MAKLGDIFHYKHDENDNGYLEVNAKGVALLQMTATNKGTAFTQEERIELGLEGLLPDRVLTIQEQVEQLYINYCRHKDDISKYQYLRAAQERNEVAFYALLEQHLDEMMPIVYTPTVGKAVQQYSTLFKSPRGLTFSAHNIDRADDILDNYPWHDVRMIVVTDASAILGIGDQGAGGLAICIGKLALYTSGGGLSPFHTLPVSLDVGTDREELRNNPSYLGVREPRLKGEAYYELVDKFVQAVKRKWPKAIIQFEDFAKDVAFNVLNKYRDEIPCFNDDIQGTGAVVLAGLISACRQKGEKLEDQRIVVVGAGAGGVGVAKVIQDGLVNAGLSREQARRQMFIMDEHGLVVEGITPDEYKGPVTQFKDTYANWDITAEVPSLMEVITHAKPTAIMGLTGVPGLFSEALIRAMAAACERPIIFPLSNPTSNCEAVPEDLFEWTDGRALVSTGSPFASVEYKGETHHIGQGNNAFVFPGIGFAAVLGSCQRISDCMIIESAYALADYTAEHYGDTDLIYPPIADLKKVSLEVTWRVLKLAAEEGSSPRKDLDMPNLRKNVASRFWQAQYLPFVYAEH